MRVRLTEALVAKTTGNGEPKLPARRPIDRLRIADYRRWQQELCRRGFQAGPVAPLHHRARRPDDRRRSAVEGKAATWTNVRRLQNPQLKRKASREKSATLAEQLDDYLDAQEVRPLTRKKYSGAPAPQLR